jgi:hypothetical protein
MRLLFLQRRAGIGCGRFTKSLKGYHGAARDYIE